MTREHLAGEAGVSPETVKALEHGKRRPGHQMLLRLAAVLGGGDVLAELVGIPAGTPGRDPSVLAIRDVIQSPASIGALPDDHDGPLTPAQVREAVGAGYAAYWAGDFTRLAGMLPDLITSARVAHHRGTPGMAAPWPPASWSTSARKTSPWSPPGSPSTPPGRAATRRSTRRRGGCARG